MNGTRAGSESQDRRDKQKRALAEVIPYAPSTLRNPLAIVNGQECREETYDPPSHKPGELRLRSAE